MGSITDAEMASVAPEEFVRTLPDQGHLYILPRALADDKHRHDGGRRDGFFQYIHYPGKRGFEGLPIKPHRSVARRVVAGGLGRRVGLVIPKPPSLDRKRPPLKHPHF